LKYATKESGDTWKRGAPGGQEDSRGCRGKRHSQEYRGKRHPRDLGSRKNLEKYS